MIKINEKAPEFNAQAFHEGKVKNISLSNYKGKWVVLFFYPADFTFICSTELEDWRFKNINFPMLADPTTKICRDYETYIENEGLSTRATFVIDPEGIIKAFEMHDNSIGRNTEELIRKIQAAQFVREPGGEVCPVNWKQGSKTLKPSLELVGKI